MYVAEGNKAKGGVSSEGLLSCWKNKNWPFICCSDITFQIVEMVMNNSPKDNTFQIVEMISGFFVFTNHEMYL